MMKSRNSAKHDVHPMLFLYSVKNPQPGLVNTNCLLNTIYFYLKKR